MIISSATKLVIFFAKANNTISSPLLHFMVQMEPSIGHLRLYQSFISYDNGHQEFSSCKGLTIRTSVCTTNIDFLNDVYPLDN